MLLCAFSFQMCAPQFPDTRNLTPETYFVLVDGSDITDYP